jgi:hypothetical protein
MSDHLHSIPRRGSLFRRALLPALAALFLDRSDPRQGSGRPAGFLADPDGAAQFERPRDMPVAAGAA